MTDTVPKPKLKQIYSDLSKSHTRAESAMKTARKKGEHSVAMMNQSKAAGLKEAMVAIKPLIE